LTLFSEANVPFESKGPGVIRGLYFFMDESSHRLNSRPAFRRFEYRRKTTSVVVTNAGIAVVEQFELGPL
jgi:hypothetical protein